MSQDYPSVEWSPIAAFQWTDTRNSCSIHTDSLLHYKQSEFIWSSLERCSQTLLPVFCVTYVTSTRSSVEPFWDYSRFIHIFIQRSIDQMVKYGWGQPRGCSLFPAWQIQGLPLDLSEIKRTESMQRYSTRGGTGAESLSRILHTTGRKEQKIRGHKVMTS